MFEYLLSLLYYYLFLIVSFFHRTYRRIFIFKSVYILDKNLHKQNKTFEFYISYFTNFKLKNKKYYKVQITNQNNILKIYTDQDYKSIYDNYKTLKACFVSKTFLSFSINDTEYKDIIKNYCFYENSILDFYIFNVDEKIKNDIEKFKQELDNMKINYKIYDISKHKITKEDKIIDNVNLPINSLFE